MIDFKPVNLDDRELLTSRILSTTRRDNNLSFANLCCWQFLTCSSYAIVEEQLVLRFCFPENRIVYTLPAGEKIGKKAISSLAHQAMEENVPLYLYGVFPELQEQLEDIYPGVFEYRMEREHYDYLYLHEDLSALQGKDFQAKRNHVNKFRKKYDYRYTPMTAEMVADCRAMYDLWCQERRCEEEPGLTYERRALEYGMKYFRDIRLAGGVLWVDGKIIAFTFGAPVNHDTFCIHAEKAMVDYEGAYNTINWEFANHLPECYIYLNREEDLGIPGLRKAKLSYRPCQLLEKGLAVCAEGLWKQLF